MSLNGIMALTLRYFNEFGKPAFQCITASLSIELIDQKSTSITHRPVKLVCITRFMHSRVDTTGKSVDVTSFNLSFKFHFTVAQRIMPIVFDA